LQNYFGGIRYEKLKQKFCPWICLCELDLVATVSFRGYEVIHRVEFQYLESPKYQRGLLKSQQELSRVSKLLENHGQQILPYELTSNAVKFDIKRAVPWLLRKFGLWEYVQRGEMVTTAATMDGGELAWQLTQVSAGIKICDERALNPLTGQRLFGDSGYEKVQSRYVCFPLYVHIARDNKEFYLTHLESFFQELNDIKDAYPLGLQFTQGADMCSLQKNLKRGGAMKNKNFGCYCCNIYKSDLARPNSTHCDDCIQLGIEEPCYHQQVSDDALMQRLQDEYNDMVRDYPYLLNFDFNKSRMRSGTTAARDRHSDYRYIDFDVVGATVASRLQFRSFVDKELQLRNKPLHQQMEANRVELKELLMIEQCFLLIKSVLSETSLEAAMIKLEKAIPCLLHLENRISDIMITFLLRRGMQLREEDSESTLRFITSIERVFNEGLFGRPGSPSNWKFPLHDDGTMGEIKLSNWCARRVVEHINDLVEVCFPNTLDDQNRWNNAFDKYVLVIKVCLFPHFFCTYSYTFR
jgi:hypothetical protein